MKHLRTHLSKGFTIIEVAIASFVMLLGISSMVLTMQAGFKTVDLARDSTIASQVLQTEMERLRMLSWANLITIPESETVDLTDVFLTQPQLASRYKLVREISTDADRADNVRNISLTVTWVDFTGKSHERMFRTIYVKNGLYDYYYTLARP